MRAGLFLPLTLALVWQLNSFLLSFFFVRRWLCVMFERTKFWSVCCMHIAFCLTTSLLVISFAVPNCDITIFLIRFTRLVGFSRGVHGAVNCGLTPVSLRNFLKARLANCTPLSVISTFAAPNLAIMRSLNAFCKVSTVAVRSVTNSVHFENRSTLVVVQQCLRTQ